MLSCVGVKGSLVRGCRDGSLSSVEVQSFEGWEETGRRLRDLALEPQRQGLLSGVSGCCQLISCAVKGAWKSLFAIHFDVRLTVA